MLRTLFHDKGRNNISLLSELNLKDFTLYIDSREFDNLFVASSGGSVPRILLPFNDYGDKDFFEGGKWSTKQDFHVLFTIVLFRCLNYVV
jgi:hypothetical protein